MLVEWGERGIWVVMASLISGHRLQELQPQKKSRLDALDRSFMRTSTPLRARTQNRTLERMSVSRATPALSIQEIVDE